MTFSSGSKTASDHPWMVRALALARAGVGLASPNPTVGCVLVNTADQLIGEGFHQYDRLDHAEVVALRQAGALAKGATAYVTLEPCSHTGRTGPCADALIAAGVARVVVATLDANLVVRGNGVARLRAAGIRVDVGMREHAAQRLNDAFAKYICTGRPWVTLKAALSSDGSIAPPARNRAEKSPYWLTGPDSRAEVQRMRHAHDALLTGIGTVLADDPLLTDRSGLPRRRHLVRAVLDSRLRMSLDAKLLQNPSDDLLIFTASQDIALAGALEARGARIEAVETNGAHLSLGQVMARLGALKLISILIEAGTGLNTTALAGGLVDELVQFHAPVSLGAGAVPFVAPGLKLPVEISSEESRFGSDLCVRRLFRSYWG